MGCVEDKLMSLGFSKSKRNSWTRARQIVQIVHSEEYDRYRMRVTWKDIWENYLAIIFDYSSVKGPICIVPTRVLFGSDFVTKKRTMISYPRSGYWWTQIFPVDHELPCLLLRYRNRWDLI